MKQVRVAVGSTNPTKVGAVKWAVEQIFQDVVVIALEVPSGVPEQPMSAAETEQGARNRARGALTSAAADFGIGLEGGVDVDSHGTGWLGGSAAVVNQQEQMWSTREFTVVLPSWITRKLGEGAELGPLMDEVTGDRDSKKKAGAIGFLSHGLIPREESWKQAVVRAFIPFLNLELYKDLLTTHPDVRR